MPARCNGRRAKLAGLTDAFAARFCGKGMPTPKASVPSCVLQPAPIPSTCPNTIYCNVFSPAALCLGSPFGFARITTSHMHHLLHFSCVLGKLDGNLAPHSCRCFHAATIATLVLPSSRAISALDHSFFPCTCILSSCFAAGRNRWRNKMLTTPPTVCCLCRQKHGEGVDIWYRSCP